MTTPKDALERARAYIKSGTGSETDLIAAINEAIASFEGDAVERVAETIWRAELRRATGKERAVPWLEISEIDRERFRYGARAILATGLVPDEAAIRAAAFEEAAKIAEDDERQDEWPKSVDVTRTSPSRIMQQTIAAALRNAGRTG